MLVFESCNCRVASSGRAACSNAQAGASAAAPKAVPAQPDAADDPITVVGWNIGLDDADIGTIAERIGAFEGVDLWGIAEVNRTNAVSALEAAPGVIHDSANEKEEDDSTGENPSLDL